MSAALLVLELAGTLSGEGFKEVKKHDNVTVYRKETPNIATLGAEGEIPGSVKTVLEVLLDYDHQPQWVKNLRESRVVGKGAGWVDVYQRLKLPIVSDRDFTLHIEYHQSEGKADMHFATANDKGPPPVKGVVRVDTNKGSWKLEQKGDKTFAVYQLVFDPAGSIPSGMGKGKAADEVAKLYSTIGGEVARRK